MIHAEMEPKQNLSSQRRDQTLVLFSLYAARVKHFNFYHTKPSISGHHARVVMNKSYCTIRIMMSVTSYSLLFKLVIVKNLNNDKSKSAFSQLGYGFKVKVKVRVKVRVKVKDSPQEYAHFAAWFAKSRCCFEYQATVWIVASIRK